jgi:hypothetical protein
MSSYLKDGHAVHWKKFLIMNNLKHISLLLLIIKIIILYLSLLLENLLLLVTQKKIMVYAIIFLL